MQEGDGHHAALRLPRTPRARSHAHESRAAPRVRHSPARAARTSSRQNEKESLLAPGTQLKVLSRKKKGKVNEIHVEEVGSALDADA